MCRRRPTRHTGRGWRCQDGDGVAGVGGVRTVCRFSLRNPCIPLQSISPPPTTCTTARLAPPPLTHPYTCFCCAATLLSLHNGAACSGNYCAGTAPCVHAQRCNAGLNLFNLERPRFEPAPGHRGWHRRSSPIHLLVSIESLSVYFEGGCYRAPCKVTDKVC